MTDTQVQDNFIVNEIASLIDPKVNAFRNVARTSVAINFAKAGFEVYGNGMPKFNSRVKALIESNKIVKTYKGKNVYYTLPTVDKDAV
jgi:hypothetical protein